ncbi:hypothetical protein NQ314_014971 [Rhamnusium bicolor]|uniref:Uncharacterized protein n=1 Tax=Rhamnusium bicolor TaxID=1586634 RepID=A0AAV8X027_9CUCU|nr:hypothetical protein NQ314_014971 [Rhamnusium bicolor]
MYIFSVYGIIIELVIAASCILLITNATLLLKDRRKRQWWVKPWLKRKRSNIDLPQEFIDGGDFKSYQNFLRKLLNKLRSRISKGSIYRECISAREKLIITLRYLATGESYRSLMYSF